MAPVSLILSSVGRISWPAAGPAAKASSATQIASADLIDTSNAIQMRVTHPPLSFLASWSGASPARRRAGDVTLREEVSGSLRRRDRHVDDTGAGIACRVPGCAALVIRHATYRNRGHVARRRNGRRCGGGRRSRRGPGDDRGRRDRLACGGAPRRKPPPPEPAPPGDSPPPPPPPAPPRPPPPRPPLCASTALTRPSTKTVATSVVPTPRHEVIFITWLPCPQTVCEPSPRCAGAALRTQPSARRLAAWPGTSNPRSPARNSTRTAAPGTAARPWPSCR